jgi:hypothetical protein
MELQPDRVGGEAVAGQPGPGDGVLAFFDPLLRRAALVVERNHSLGRTGQAQGDASLVIIFAGGRQTLQRRSRARALSS